MDHAPAAIRDAAPARPALPDPVWLLLAWGLARRLQFAIAAGGYGGDVISYFRAASLWASGGAPYASAPIEYPPGALPVFLAPLLVGGRDHYVKAFLGEMALFDLGALWLVATLAKRLWPGQRARQLAAGLGYVAATALLQPVLYARFDLAPAALVLGSLAFPAAPLGAALLGLAGAMKLWPLALAPVWLLAARRRGADTLRLGAVLALAFAAPFLLVLPRAGTAVLGVWRYHAARGLQLESTWATLGRFSGGEVRLVDEFGAIHLRCGPLCEGLRELALPALLLLALAPAALLLASARRRELTLEDEVRAAAAVVLGVLAGSHVLSPQFLVWVVPLLVLAGSGGGGVAAAVLLAGLTTAIYPALYTELTDAQLPGHGVAVLVLVARNAGLVLAYATLVRAQWRDRQGGGGGGASPSAPVTGSGVPR